MSLQSHLHPSLAEAKPLTQLFPHESVRIVSLVKQVFKLKPETQVRSNPGLRQIRILIKYII